MLVGRPPFVGANALDVMAQVLNVNPVAPSRLAARILRDLEVICLKCLEKEPERRYPTAGELAEELRRFLEGRPIAAQAGAARQANVSLVPPSARGGVAAGGADRCPDGRGGRFNVSRSQGHRTRPIGQRRARKATAARDEARDAQRALARLSADLYMDRALTQAAEGHVSDSLHFMLAALATSPDPDFQKLARFHLATWKERVPTLAWWLDTPHSQYAFSPDGKTLATAGKEGAEASAKPINLQFWNLATGGAIGPPIVTPDLGVRSLAFSPDGLSLLAGNGSIQRYQYWPGWATALGRQKSPPHRHDPRP